MISNWETLMQGSAKLVDNQTHPMNVMISIGSGRTSTLQPNLSFSLKKGAQPSAIVWLNGTLRQGSSYLADV